MPLVPQIRFQAFEKWVIDFVGPIITTGKRKGARYIIIVTDYLTRCAEAAIVKDSTDVDATNFLFDNVVTRFRCMNILISDQGMHFVNHLIEELTKEF